MRARVRLEHLEPVTRLGELDSANFVEFGGGAMPRKLPRYADD